MEEAPIMLKSNIFDATKSYFNPVLFIRYVGIVRPDGFRNTTQDSAGQKKNYGQMETPLVGHDFYGRGRLFEPPYKPSCCAD